MAQGCCVNDAALIDVPHMPRKEEFAQDTRHRSKSSINANNIPRLQPNAVPPTVLPHRSADMKMRRNLIPFGGLVVKQIMVDQ